LLLGNIIVPSCGGFVVCAHGFTSLALSIASAMS
jgi:hypothetical protein